MRKLRISSRLSLCLLILLPCSALAGPVGEIHLVTQDASAALRDSAHRADVRVTIWYPAKAGSVEQPLLVGPAGAPVFRIGSVARSAAPAAGPALPVIVLSHGFGGSARVMGWFGITLARAGNVVVAVDHPGNNAVDPMTLPGAVMVWDRAEDLRAALTAAEHDPVVGPYIDPSRLGVAGFSAGGLTALVAAGARVVPARLMAFCQTHPRDGVCRPQLEFKVDPAAAKAALATPVLAAEAARAGDDHALPGVRAVFAMAPAVVQALDPASLAALHTPVFVLLGAADTVAPPATNGRVAAAAIPGATLLELQGVGHYDFLATCTEAGRRYVPQCNATVPQDVTHLRAVQAATQFFAANLK